MLGFPGGANGKESTCQEMQETWVWSVGQEDPLEKEVATHPVLLPGKSRGQRILVGYSPWGCKESDTTEQLSAHTVYAIHMPGHALILYFITLRHLLQYNFLYNFPKNH